ncbi:hypothetical protein Rs2_01689 [Raphanus sativus]|uniref:Protein ROH1 n=1 Tax=Raphanus sativus TaxID=3726 RepID=A0A6J0JLL5_RAPSA|nr:protein ROH1 [Raphanus sativus]KAJ4916139.1 hypothetical protein Rs2_01689 [Raphanus sativus]
MLLSFRRDQVDSNAASHNNNMEAELDSFQRQVAEKFTDLNASSSGDDLLSLEWIGKLLDSFLCCQEEFRAIVFNHRSQISASSSPTNRLVSDYFERSIKALDVCNAIRDGVEQIRQWQKLSDIVISALDSRRANVGEGQLRRAKKALVDLAIGMLDEKDSTRLAHRNRSFGRAKDGHNRSMGQHLRSLSWSVSRSWSASKQLQALASNLTTPRQNDVGLAVPVYTMTSVLLFVMWVLVAAIPCQDRGLQVSFFVPRQFRWAAPVMSLHDKIVEESKRRDRKNCCGLLKEIGRIEKSSRVMNELIDSIHFPMSEEKESEVKQRVEELVEVHEALKNGLDPFERKVREVFHRIVRSRTESLDSLC